MQKTVLLFLPNNFRAYLFHLPIIGIFQISKHVLSNVFVRFHCPLYDVISCYADGIGALGMTSIMLKVFYGNILLVFYYENV